MNIDTLQWYHHLLIGAASRATAISFMYPLDTMKTMIQNNATVSNSNLVYFHKNYYKGYQYALLTQTLYGMTVFGIYENLKLLLLKTYPKDTSTMNIYLQSALIADFTGSVLLCPIEVVKQNIQIGRYTSASYAFYGIHKTEGVKGLYKGYYSLLSRDLPFRCIQLPLYDKLKETYSNNKQQNLNIPISALLGASASIIAGAITTPTDVIKTYLMCNSRNKQSGSNHNISNSIYHIYNAKGFFGFFSGLSQRILFLGGSSSIFFMTYEYLRNLLTIY